MNNNVLSLRLLPEGTRFDVFCLCLLPDNALLQVIRSFDYFQLISLSLVSTKIKALVESLKLKIRHLRVVVVEDSLSLYVTDRNDFEFLKFKIYQETIEPSGEPLINLNRIPNSIYIRTRPPGDVPKLYLTWKNPGLSFKQFFQHIQSLFKIGQNCVDFNAEHEVFDIVAIRKLLPEWDRINFGDASGEYPHKICELFSPNTKALFICTSEQLQLQFPQKIAINNFEVFDFYDPLSLDDLLVSNAVDIGVSNFSLSDSSRFLKFWIRGSNPRLRKISIYLEGPDDLYIDEKLILKGIKHHVMPEDLERKVNSSTIRGGFDIMNKRGIRATIEIRNGSLACVSLYVWD